MDELVQFLRDRLDEDERTALAATPGPWEQSGIGDYGWTVSFSRPGAGVEAEDSDQGRADAAHIARHDPARVLAEVEAKRRMLDEHKPARPEYLPRRELGCLTCTTAQAWDEKANEANCLTLRLLALPYADHPDYCEEWRP